MERKKNVDFIPVRKHLLHVCDETLCTHKFSQCSNQRHIYRSGGSFRGLDKVSSTYLKECFRHINAMWAVSRVSNFINSHGGLRLA